MGKLNVQIALILGLLLFAGEALATDTRIQSLGGKEKYWTVLDEAGTLYLPATLINFPNTVYIDGGVGQEGTRTDTVATNTPYNVGFGVHYSFSENSVIALYGSSLSRYVADPMMTRAFMWTEAAELLPEDTEGDQAMHNADHRGTLLYAHRFGSLRLGALVSWWGDNYEVTEPSTQELVKGGSTIMGALGLGVDFKNQSSADVAIRFHAGSFSDDKAASGSMVTRMKADTDWGVGILARGVIALKSGDRVIPYLDFNTGGSGVTWNTGASNAPDATYTYFGITAGSDIAFRPLEDVLIQPGVGLTYRVRKMEERGETSVDESDLLLPFFGVSVDARIVSWLSVRTAARQTVLFQTLTQQKSTDAQTEFTVGVGMNFGQFSMDLMVNPAFLLDGPSILSGKELAGGFAAQAGLRYIW